MSGSSALTTFGENDDLLTTPMRAVIPASATLPTTIAAANIAAFNLALPISATFRTGGASPCVRGDTNNDGQRNASDTASFVSVLLSGTADPLLACRADLNADTLNDGQDIGAFVQCVIGGACP